MLQVIRQPNIPVLPPPMVPKHGRWGGGRELVRPRRGGVSSLVGVEIFVGDGRRCDTPKSHRDMSDLRGGRRFTRRTPRQNERIFN